MATVSQTAFCKMLALNAKYVEKSGARIFHSMRRPWCDNPRPRHLVARKSVSAGLPAENGTPFHLDIWVPCRRCEKCLAMRKMDWRARIGMETRAHERTWFVTLTFRPASRKRLFMEDNSDGVQVMRSPEARHTRAMGEVTNFLKRLRSALTGADYHNIRLRFFAVTEEHQDGTPHIHLLVHTGGEVKKSAIESAKWSHGFWSAKLVDAEAAKYLTKYLTKEVHRVRASIRYGYADLSKSSHVTETEGDQTPRQNQDLSTLAAPMEGTAKVARAEAAKAEPVAMLRAMVYNGELKVDDYASLLATLVDLRSVDDGSGVAKSPKARKQSGDTATTASVERESEAAQPPATAAPEPPDPVSRDKGSVEGSKKARSRPSRANRSMGS